MKYLFTHKKSFPSGRILATKLGLKVTSRDSNIKEPPVIRYGNSSKPFGDNDTKLNFPDIIRLCSNSLLFSSFCAEHNFKSPIYYKHTENLDYPFLLRRKYHVAGLDIIYIENEEQLNNVKDLYGYYKVPFFETEYEIGVHIVMEKVVKIFKKIKIDSNSHPFIRSMRKGYRYSLISNLDNNFKRAQELAISLSKEMNLNFGRIDMAFLSKERDYIIWEVNSAPGLNNNTAELYATTLRKVIGVDNV